ncbi:MAG: HipA domain-containing protein [Deltaproteobacteria bacterium]|jgi:serine/threonine-protein kinase HipA|nr:HipA domain-containing protein [Deltaproteobacteria bacterium]
MDYPENLIVTWGKETVGFLHQKPKQGSFTFQYDDNWLDNNFPPISFSLPLRNEPYNWEDCINFFQNLIPEGDSLNNIATYKRLSTNNIYDFLRRYGKECAGALIIHDSNEEIDYTNHTYIDVTDQILDAISNPKKKDINLLVLTNARLSLAGAQNKLPVLFKKDKFYIPAKDSIAATTHIIKPASTRFKKLHINETFCMKLAEELGLPVAKSDILTIDKVDIYITERYDRKIMYDGTIQKLHQEDFCQALGYPNSRKYESSGGPGIKQCLDFIINNDISDQTTAKLNFSKLLIFNFIIGNCDAHAKNISILYDFDDKNIINHSLAPFYDLVSTKIYKNLSRELAMFIGKTKEHGLLSKESINILIEDLQFEKKDFGEMAFSFIQNIQNSVRKIMKIYSSHDEICKFQKVLYRIINTNCKLFLNPLHKLLHSPKNRPRP